MRTIQTQNSLVVFIYKTTLFYKKKTPKKPYYLCGFLQLRRINQKKLTMFLQKPMMLIVLLFSFLFVACEQETLNTETDAYTTAQLQELLPAMGIHPEGAEFATVTTAAGTAVEVVAVNGLLIPVTQLDQYATTSKASHVIELVDVSTPRTIQVVSRGLTDRLDDALAAALADYNALDLQLSFTFSIGTQPGDIVVYLGQTVDPKQAGETFLPFNGNPGGGITINRQKITPLSESEWKAVFLQEIGHALGLTHSDWSTKRSCGGNVVFRPRSNQTIQIPGTDATGDFVDSVMKSCGHDVSEFTEQDRIALRYLYGQDDTNGCIPNAQQCDQSKPWRYFFCGQCYESPKQAVDNGCTEASACVELSIECQPNAQQCDQSKPWKYFFCGQCYESAQQAVDNGCQEANACTSTADASCQPNTQQCDQSKPWKYFFCGQCYESAQQAADNGCTAATECL